MQKPRREPDLNSLGFQSVASLASALGMERVDWKSQLKSCAEGYPYSAWREPKRSGGYRLIEHPCPELKTTQGRLNGILGRLRIPATFHGSVPGTSILTNAKSHLEPSWFLGLDLANYYQTIRPAKVYQQIVALGAAPDVARDITRLCTIKGHVPQGAPTSPMIASIAMLDMARRLNVLVGRYGGKATIYGDNVSISGPPGLVKQRSTIVQIVRTEGFRIRTGKTVFCPPSESKSLPGVLICDRRVEIYPHDLELIQQIIDACHRLGRHGLSQRVCSRYYYKLDGFVRHYTWVNELTMVDLNRKFRAISWPNEYQRTPCNSRHKCYCSPVGRLSSVVNCAPGT